MQHRGYPSPIDTRRGLGRDLVDEQQSGERLSKRQIGHGAIGERRHGAAYRDVQKAPRFRGAMPSPSMYWQQQVSRPARPRPVLFAQPRLDAQPSDIVAEAARRVKTVRPTPRTQDPSP